MIGDRGSRFFTYLFLLALGGMFFSASVRHNPDPFFYTVKPGDTLTKIAEDVGNVISWLDIYKANERQIDNPHLIYPGQKFVLPSTIASSTLFPLNEKEIQKMVAMSSDSADFQKQTKSQRLKKFRKAFQSLVSSDESETSENSTPSYEGLGLGGLILDETRSKMGSNFYSVFYKHWEDPKDVQNFTITVSEQPMPSRGTLVQVEIDNQLVFKNRLEPRYYKTEQAAKRAVKICQRRLQRIAAMENELAGY